MEELVRDCLNDAKEQMLKAVAFFEDSLSKIRAGKAMPQMLEGVMVDYYGSPTPLSQVANINCPDGKTILVQPWEKPMVEVIEKAIGDANLGFNPSSDGTNIRINLPPLTTERRIELVKTARNEGENGKIAIRAIRKETNDTLKDLKSDGLSEDAVKDAEEKVQVLTNEFIVKVDNHLDRKEKDIMTV
ncbi:MAG: ribosome recycling factor [Sphingobacteriales bacterium]|jgi:ribosome recycling factor